MKRWSALIFTIATATLFACGPASDGLWYRGDLGAATKRAAEENTLVFVEFYTDWCSWCRRLESETLTDGEVKQELSKFVAIRLDAEKGGLEAARRFGVDSYPTMIFLDPTGEEVERISGYLPPDKFIEELRRIRTGDTLFACLQELEDDPTNIEAMRRAVDGLLERADPEGAIARITSFHAENEHDHDVCAKLMFHAGRDLHYRVYMRAGKLYRNGWKTSIEVPSVPGTERLAELLQNGLLELDPIEQAELMRTARFDDSLELLNIAGADKAEGDELFGLGAFAFRGGHYKLAADLYGRWFGEAEAGHSADMLNRAAWQLYLARESIDTGIAMARQAYDLDPSADVADTLARLLYVRGDHMEAVELERKAAESAQGGRAEQYLEVADKMQRLIDLDDEPAFETYPGPREISL